MIATEVRPVNQASQALDLASQERDHPTDMDMIATVLPVNRARVAPALASQASQVQVLASQERDRLAGMDMETRDIALHT